MPDSEWSPYRPGGIAGPPASDRRELPASRDRGGGWSPYRPGGIADPTRGGGPNASPDDEGLIGVYPYSGADIKLVVHLPPEDPRAANPALQEALEEQERVRIALESATSEEETLTQLESQLASDREQLQGYHEIVETYEGGGTDPHVTREEAETNIELLNERISEVTSMINAARRNGNREDLEEQSRTLARQIEALREEDGGVTARTKVIAEISTLSISTHREKYPVRPLGTVYPRSIVRGPRSIGGSVVFTTFNQHVMQEFLEATEYRSTGVGDWDRFRWTSYVMDQIPPLDISISFANEYGNLSWAALLGVEFVNEGQVMSIEDLYLEGTAQFIARDYDPIRSVANRRLSRTHGVGQALSGTSIMMRDLRRRMYHRNIPWI
jgi:hypothetical protein